MVHQINTQHYHYHLAIRLMHLGCLTSRYYCANSRDEEATVCMHALMLCESHKDINHALIPSMTES